MYSKFDKTVKNKRTAICSALFTNLILVIILFTVAVVAACQIPYCLNCWGVLSKCELCLNGYYVSITGSSCLPCRTECGECTGWFTCTACHVGRWGSSCQNDCNLCKNGNCLNDDCVFGCKDGYYKLTDSCTPCPAYCTKCDSSTSCSECMAGSWGSYCQNDCDLCKYGISHCSKIRCDYGCIDGYYGGTDSCNRCPTYCTKCDSSTSCSECVAWRQGSLCQDCVDGYYAVSDSCQQCPVGCTACTGSTSCSHCVAGRWGGSCQNYCPAKCTKCNSSTSCIECVAGRQGSLCQDCVDGYYAVSESCQKCPAGCTACTGSTSCNECVASRWGSYCHNDCFLCKYGINYCSKSKCNHGCIDGYYELTDSCTRCPTSCTKCDRSTSCTECVSGKYGVICDTSCSPGCRRDNDTATCAMSDGRCHLGCQKGRWNYSCDNSCNDDCVHGACTVSRGFCLDGCKRGYFGGSCESRCSENCLVADPMTDTNICSRVGGVCSGGCRVGFYGDTCGDECSNCQNTTCHRSNGTCVQVTDDESAASSEIGPIVGGLAAALIVIVMVVGVIVLYKKGYRIMMPGNKSDTYSSRVYETDFGTDRRKPQNVADREAATQDSGPADTTSTGTGPGPIYEEVDDDTQAGTLNESITATYEMLEGGQGESRTYDELRLPEDQPPEYENTRIP